MQPARRIFKVATKTHAATKEIFSAKPTVPTSIHGQAMVACRLLVEGTCLGLHLWLMEYHRCETLKVEWNELVEIHGLRTHTQLWIKGYRHHTREIVAWDLMTSTTGAWVQCQLTEERLGVVGHLVWRAWILGVEARKSRFHRHPQVAGIRMAMILDMIQAILTICMTGFLVTPVMTQAVALAILTEVPHILRRMSAMSALCEGVQVERPGAAWAWTKPCPNVALCPTMSHECMMDLLAQRRHSLGVHQGLAHMRSMTTSHLNQLFRPRAVEPAFVIQTLVSGEGISASAKNRPLPRRGHSEERPENQKRPLAPALALGVVMSLMKAPRCLQCHDQAERPGQLDTALSAPKASTT